MMVAPLLRRELRSTQTRPGARSLPGVGKGRRVAEISKTGAKQIGLGVRPKARTGTQGRSRSAYAARVRNPFDPASEVARKRGESIRARSWPRRQRVRVERSEVCFDRGPHGSPARRLI